MFQIGTGYNPGFIATQESKRLRIPNRVALIELGPGEWKHLKSNGLVPNIPISLHLSRTPITEDAASQDAFLSYLFSELDGSDFLSIGMHLSGSRKEGIGKYGFSSHYVPSPEREERARRFILSVQARGSEVWIENANYYSSSSRELLRTWKSVTELCRNTGAKLIFDVSHAYVDAKNVGLEPWIILGAIDWSLVAEIHLAGVITGRDGTFHDGHQFPVPPEVWRLTEGALALVPQDKRPIYLTLEHTDSSWAERRHAYYGQFRRLQKALEWALHASPETSLASRKSDNYASRFLMKNLEKQIPKLRTACEQRRVSFDCIFEDWVNERIRSGSSLAMVRETLSAADAFEFIYAPQDLLDYSLGRLKS